MPVIGGVLAQAAQGLAGGSAVAGPAAAGVVIGGIVAVLILCCPAAGTPG